MVKAPSKRDHRDDRWHIVSSVTTPLGFFALTALIVEGILGTFAARATGADFSFLVYAIVGTFILLIVMFGLLLLKQGTTVIDSIRPAPNPQSPAAASFQHVPPNGGDQASKSADISIPQGLEKELIRCSFSGLIRIEAGGLYLLVRGHKISHQYQPVGGVFKHYAPSKPELRRLGVLSDDKMPIDDETKDDLRVRVRGDRLNRFVRWFESRRGRETSPWREFHEELVVTGILKASLFPHIAYSWEGTYINGIRRSEHFQCEELLIAEIFELHPTQAQFDYLMQTQKEVCEEYRWVTAAQIAALGLSPSVGVTNISPTAQWMLAGS